MAKPPLSPGRCPPPSLRTDACFGGSSAPPRPRSCVYGAAPRGPWAPLPSAGFLASASRRSQPRASSRLPGPSPALPVQLAPRRGPSALPGPLARHTTPAGCLNSSLWPKGSPKPRNSKAPSVSGSDRSSELRPENPRAPHPGSSASPPRRPDPLRNRVCPRSSQGRARHHAVPRPGPCCPGGASLGLCACGCP